MASIEPNPVPRMGDDAPDMVAFPLISMAIRTPLAGRNRGRYAKIWLHPDGSVTWAPHDVVAKRHWWKFRK